MSMAETRDERDQTFRGRVHRARRVIIRDLRGWVDTFGMNERLGQTGGHRFGRDLWPEDNDGDRSNDASTMTRRVASSHATTHSFPFDRESVDTIFQGLPNPLG